MYGHKGHGLAFQGIFDAYGLCVHLSGAYAGRYQDNTMVRVSNIVEVWEQGLIDAELIDDELDISMLGDKIYVTTRFIKSLYSGALTEAAQHDNDIMIPVRAFGEWGYNKIGEYWKGLIFERAVKVGEQPYGIYD